MQVKNVPHKIKQVKPILCNIVLVLINFFYHFRYFLILTELLHIDHLPRQND